MASYLRTITLAALLDLGWSALPAPALARGGSGTKLGCSAPRPSAAAHPGANPQRIGPGRGLRDLQHLARQGARLSRQRGR